MNDRMTFLLMNGRKLYIKLQKSKLEMFLNPTIPYWGKMRPSPLQ